MANLADTAQITMDLYYQNYKTDEDFFKLHHFLYLCGVAYSKILEDEFKQSRLEAKIEEGFSEIYLQDDWLVEQTVKMQKDEEGDGYTGLLKKPLFSFPNDPYSFGIQSIRAAGKTKCQRFVRTSARESWMDCQLPVTSRIFYFISGKSLIVRNSVCELDELVLLSVPEISDVSFGEDGGPVPKSKEDLIMRKTLEILLKAREGTVVDTSNNSNPNKALQTEIDNTFPNLNLRPRSA